MKVIKAAICALSMLCISRCVCMPAKDFDNLRSQIDELYSLHLSEMQPASVECCQFICKFIKEVLHRCIDNQSKQKLSFMKSEAEVVVTVNKLRILLESFIRRNDHTEEELILMRETALVMEAFRINAKKPKIKNELPFDVTNKLSSLFNEMSGALYVHYGQTKMHRFYVEHDESRMRSASVQCCEFIKVEHDESRMRSASVQCCEFIKEVLQHCIDNRSNKILSFMTSEVEDKLRILSESFIRRNDHTEEELILMRETALVMEAFDVNSHKKLCDSDDYIVNTLNRKYRLSKHHLISFFKSLIEMRMTPEEHKLNKAHEELREALKKETDPFANLDNETSSDEEQYEKDKQKNEKQYALLFQQYIQ